MKLRITADANQWIVNEVSTLGEKSKTPGTVTLRARGFYPSLPSALRGASDMLLRAACQPEGFDPAEMLGAAELLLVRAEALVELSK